MTNWKKKRVFITGAGGFIGSHLAEALTQSGARVRAMVHYRGDGSWGWLDASPLRKDMEVLPGDVRDAEFVRHATEGVDVIFHLAALIGIPYSYRAPGSYVATNVGGTLNILEAARLHDVERVVHTSTSEVYGTARYVPMDEQHPLQAQSPYAATKIAADQLADSYFRSFRTPVVIVRPFNTFGPRQSGRAVIPTILQQLLNGKSIALGNLHPLRDFNYVANTVEGMIRAGESQGVVGQTINLGTGRDIRIRDLVLLVARRVGLPVRWTPEKRRMRPKGSEVERLKADIRLAKRLLRWTPRISLEDGLDRTLDWFKSGRGRFRVNSYDI